MAKNRLQLDFSLEQINDRKDFVNIYIQEDQFKKKPLTETELETIANYILWGKDEDGKSLVQKKEIEMETKYSTWNKNRKVESLEELMENPAFDENTIMKTGSVVPTKQKREVFNREQALKEAPDYLISDYEALFRQIDETDLAINYYEMIIGKRKNPPREELLNRFTISEQEEIYEKAKKLNQRTYLKLRHYLVDLRTSQFTLRDSYHFQIQKETRIHLKYEGESASIGQEIPVLPLGIFDNSMLAENIFITQEELKDKIFKEKELKEISDFYWSQNNLNLENGKMYFDFCNLEHVYQLILTQEELEVELEEIGDVSVTTDKLLKTLNFYISLSQLNEMHREILTLKIQKEKNENIAKYINEKYNKTYTINYISTIFRQKIIKEINAAAEFHKEIIENIFFPENFRTCTKCGEYLLKSPYNFVRKSRAADGFTGRCKRCDRLVREERKISKEEKK